ncbi:hypothetical protein PT285_03845 [Lactobacillus sp. ESL0791]|uniref:hypothetical protein n=1 Tax=Lactobacillus sp. ESL0791 TaxID=2983234 RepID=UPI0023F9A41E|nr:hypothetical protein [Lactobacillus sp. ESL0791]MDF7638542.1 hypothetical protein [Lactobacillus sp. ESL0791]
MDYQKILDELANGKLEKYEVDPQTAFDFQTALRAYGKRQNITGRALRGGKIIYTRAEASD